ncbi:hypothetical protein CCAX7_17660 [Capsulimonas corticalis]|uniref:Uncharacterized protein n=1 Tax=Capsulimonas corticalis TaxID=2219043 RepID=A0A402D412_9BACT|nr:hypothetical protein [Capsulimonas corticalis]BDI29715.1 hypothetical protein CCAX7_17660 [Capsulimonas corticalis]
MKRFLTTCAAAMLLSAPVLSHAEATAAEPLVVEVAASTRCVNVMGKAKPSLPADIPLAIKRGIVRGYVRDSQGHPLRGAVIGVRSSAIGGAYSGAAGKTDAKGYYEVAAPWGAASFYCAGYTVEYGDGIAAMGLCPADGDIDGFATADGAVKNWVLVPFGVADRAGVQDNPQYSGNYYGGTVIVNYQIDTDAGDSNSKALPPNSQIELTFTPEGPLVDGRKGRTIVVRRMVGDGWAQSLYVNNIPVAPYHLTAKLVDGGPLKIKETGMYRNEAFGLDPKESTDGVSLLLKADGAKPNMVTAAHGNWREMQITLERP